MITKLLRIYCSLLVQISEHVYFENVAQHVEMLLKTVRNSSSSHVARFREHSVPCVVLTRMNPDFRSLEMKNVTDHIMMKKMPLAMENMVSLALQSGRNSDLLTTFPTTLSLVTNSLLTISIFIGTA